MAQRGRKTKLTAELQERFLEVIRRGNYYKTACEVVGITERTFYNWMGRGLEEGGQYGAFCKEVLQAEAEAEVKVVEAWVSKTEGDWRACRDFLARRWPGRWGKRRRGEVEIGIEREEVVKVKFDLSALPVEILRMLAEDEDIALSEAIRRLALLSTEDASPPPPVEHSKLRP